jgi:hypothetical protein
MKEAFYEINEVLNYNTNDITKEIEELNNKI